MKDDEKIILLNSILLTCSNSPYESFLCPPTMWLLVFCWSLSILSIMSLTFQPGICNKDVNVCNVNRNERVKMLKEKKLKKL
jgi:hypothetical protein